MKRAKWYWRLLHWVFVSRPGTTWTGDEEPLMRVKPLCKVCRFRTCKCAEHLALLEPTEWGLLDAEVDIDKAWWQYGRTIEYAELVYEAEENRPEGWLV